MKNVILSRKGMDSSFGNFPSPVFRDGSMVSLPIPDSASPVQYGNIALSGQSRSMGDVLSELSHGRYDQRTAAHLDPDLRGEAMQRARGWRASFGQQGAPQTHLRERGIGIGDLFLFFGWFREVEYSHAGLRYRTGALDRHVLFGWLFVGEVINLTSQSAPQWAKNHPHLHGVRPRNNTLYCASSGEEGGIAGAGVFNRIHPGLVLTDPGSLNRSIWRLPTAFSPGCMSFHEDKERWEAGSQFTGLRSVGRGQEFVINVERYPDIGNWAISVIASCADA